jgi:hypothetical protein
MYYLELFLSYGVLTAVILTFVIFIHEIRGLVDED